MVFKFIKAWLQSVLFTLPLPVVVMPAGNCCLANGTVSQPLGQWRRLWYLCAEVLERGRLFFNRRVRALPWELITLPCSLTGQIL